MKKILLICLIITAIIGLIYSYFNNNQILVKQDDITEVISGIRKEYKKVNADNNLTVIEKGLIGLSTEGGTLLCYYDKNRNLEKAVTTFYGEMGKTIIEYYYKNKNLIFCFQQQIYYDQPIYMEGFKVDKIEEDRYYFHNQNLIKWIDNKKVNRNINNQETEKVAKELILEASAILEGVYE